MVKLSKYILGLLLPMLALSACSKMESGMDDMIQVLPPVEEEEKVPSKYQEGDLVSMVFTVEESEETKITLGEEGSGTTGGTSRRVSWNEGDEIMFVWGPDAEDCCIGVAQKTDVKTDFIAEKVYKEATTVYAVTPASAYHSFVKSANWDTDGTGTVKVDIRKQGGSFEDAYIAVARTKLESRKMRFKTLCGYVAVNPTNFIVGGFKLANKGTQAISAVIPVTAEMSGDYTGNLTTGTFEETSTEVVAQSSVAGDKFYVAVLPGSSFAEGMTLSYLDAYGVTVGAATLRNNTSVAQNHILEFASSLNQYFSRDYYVKVDGSGDKTGTSWDHAWSLTEMMAYTKDVTRFEPGLKSDAVINIHLEAGTYKPTSTIVLNAKYLEDPSDKSDEWKLSNCRKYNLLGGYHAEITNETAASLKRDAASYPTIISGSSMAQNINLINLVAPVRAGVSGFTVQNKTVNATGINAFRFTINEGVMADMQAEVKHCKFTNNKNTNGVGAAMAIAMNEQGPLYHDITIEDCEFTGNSSGAGPAINMDGNYAQAKIYNCVFKENKVDVNYNAGKQTHGGAVKVSRGSPTFKNCTFEGNSTAHGSGGAVWITDETAGSGADGGGTDAYPFVATFENCTFTGNTTTSAYGKGGAVYVARFYEANFNNCTFTGNKTTTSSATSYGGAIMVGACQDNADAKVMRGNVHALNLNNCHFENNLVNRTAFLGAVPGGSAVAVYKPENYEVNVNIDGGSFNNHAAPYVEGVVLYGISGTLSVKNATFSNNTNVGTSSAKATASVLYVKDCNTTVENSHFDNNKSSGGGTIFLNGEGDFSMVGGSMTNNTSPVGAPAFRVSSNFNSPETKRKITLRDVRFEKNVSNGGFGGAVAIYKNTDADFTNCQFIEN
ncbi:MAG: hypothetical protein IIX64_06240, partial [Bacteroidales bacterium]|nr:hypothetical protein [Bacteroidales bacterium]